MWELIGHVAADPHRRGGLLRRELSGQLAARRGPYRVLYTIDAADGSVEILGVAHRDTSYRRR